MPRLPNSLIRKARKISPFLPLVLQATRTLDTAINELRWLTDHLIASPKLPPRPRDGLKQLHKLCKLRASGKPLQYILGSQPFGNLDIKCRPGVLIPRPETEAYTIHLADLFLKGELHPRWNKEWVELARDNWKHFDRLHDFHVRIQEPCTGTGCISLLLHAMLSAHFRHILITGSDFSYEAVSLAKENFQRNAKLGHFPGPAMKGFRPDYQIKFVRRSLLRSYPVFYEHYSADIVVCNPPYISPKKYMTETSRSVRLWEPRSALVPPALLPSLKDHQDAGIYQDTWQKGDTFYDKIFRGFCGQSTNQPFVILMEVGDDEQALRVIDLGLKTAKVREQYDFQIWRDWPDQQAQDGEVQSVMVEDIEVPVKGSGKMRSILLLLKSEFMDVGGSRPHVPNAKTVPQS